MPKCIVNVISSFFLKHLQDNYLQISFNYFQSEIFLPNNPRKLCHHFIIPNFDVCIMQMAFVLSHSLIDRREFASSRNTLATSPRNRMNYVLFPSKLYHDRIRALKKISQALLRDCSA